MAESLIDSNERDPRFKGVYICIAIETEEVIAALDEASSRLPKAKRDYHLTLRFIKSLSPAQLKSLTEAVAAICGSCQPFELTLANPGSFPGVAWYGLKPSPELAELQTAVDRAVLTAGLPPADYDYSPHITLARIKSPSQADLLPVEPRSWLVEALEIRQSKKAASGSDLIERIGF